MIEERLKNRIMETKVDKKVCAVILGAGKGTRMNSSVPKVLVKIHGTAMLEWVVKALKKTGVSSICTVINKSMDYKMIKDISPSIYVCYQELQLGTGDAVASCGVFLKGIQRPLFNQARASDSDEGKFIDTDYILVCSGDCPGINPVTVSEFIDSFLSSGFKIGLVGMRPDNPFGYGRLVQDKEGNLLAIVEEKDASIQEKKISLCNSGVIIARKEFLFECLKKLLPSNSQKEYYLTDCFKIASEVGEKIFVYEASDYREFLGVNDQDQLEKMSSILKRS